MAYLSVCRCQPCPKSRIRTRSVWAGVLSTLIMWCCPPVCYTLGMNTHTPTFKLFPGVTVTPNMFIYFTYMLSFTIRSVWITSESKCSLHYLQSFTSVFSTLFYYFVFAALSVSCQDFPHFSYSLFSFSLFVYRFVPSLCTFLSWRCLWLYMCCCILPIAVLLRA